MEDRQRKPRGSWLGRLVRGHRLDRNPLRRRSDRAETVILTVFALGFAAGAPFAALTSGTWEHAAAHREQAAQEASWRLVPAVVQGAPAPGAPPVTGGRVALFDATARWTAPDGVTVVSQIPVPSGAKPGTTVRIWVARDGAPVQAPMRDSQIPARVALAEAGAVTALAVTVAGAGLLARRSLDTRRMAAWDAEWRSAGPRWTTRT